MTVYRVMIVMIDDDWSSYEIEWRKFKKLTVKSDRDSPCYYNAFICEFW